MNTRFRLLASIGIPLLLIVLVVGAFIWQQRAAGTAASPHGTQKMPTMKLGLDWTPNTNHTGIYVALKKGWNGDEGINGKLLPFSAKAAAALVVGRGKADLGLMQRK